MTSPRTGPTTLLAALLLFALIASYAASARGPWLDEFWSWYLSQPAMSPERIWSRWQEDTHPPLANALYWLVRQTGAASIQHARVILNLAALFFLGASLLLFQRRNPEQGRTYLVFGLLLLGVASTIPSFVEFRSYFWQIAAAAVALSYGYYLFTGPDHAVRRAGRADVVGLFALLVLLLLHYVTTLLMAPLFGFVALALWLQGRRGPALRLGVPLIAGTGLAGSTALLQAQTMAGVLDVRWIQSDTWQAALLMLLTLGAALARAAVPLLVGLLLTRPLPPRPATADIRFARLLLLGLATGGALLLLVNVAQPVVIFRYLLTWEVTVAFLAALLLAPAVAQRPAILWAVAGWSLLLAVLGAASANRDKGWQEGIEVLADARQRCPGSSLYAAPHWRFGPFADSRSAAFETPVIMTAYRELAGRDGLDLEVLDQRTPAILAIRPDCPTLLLLPRLFGVPDVSAKELLGAGRLRPAEPASVRFHYRSNDTIVVVLRAR
jgi:hypothetical protein